MIKRITATAVLSLFVLGTLAACVPHKVPPGQIKKHLAPGHLKKHK